MKLHADSISAIKSIRGKAASSARIVFVSGNFNILHPGHLRLLRFASECGDFLVVGVNEDGATNTLLSELLRLEGVQSNSWVNQAFILRDSSANFIATLQPAFVIKGKEYENSMNAEQDAVDQYGGVLLFGSGDISFSSVDFFLAVSSA